MATCDLFIKNGKILRDGELVEADICITGKTITSIQKISTIQSGHTINAEGMILLPGLIDPHVHFRDPGLTHKEDFATGTRSGCRRDDDHI